MFLNSETEEERRARRREYAERERVRRVKLDKLAAQRKTVADARAARWREEYVEPPSELPTFVASRCTRPLFQWQTEAIAWVLANFTSERRAMVCAAPGVGKSMVAAEVIARTRFAQLPTVVLTPTTVLRQLADELRCSGVHAVTLTQDTPPAALMQNTVFIASAHAFALRAEVPRIGLLVLDERGAIGTRRSQMLDSLNAVCVLMLSASAPNDGQVTLLGGARRKYVPVVQKLVHFPEETVLLPQITREIVWLKFCAGPGGSGGYHSGKLPAVLARLAAVRAEDPDAKVLLFGPRKYFFAKMPGFPLVSTEIPPARREEIFNVARTTPGAVVLAEKHAAMVGYNLQFFKYAFLVNPPVDLAEREQLEGRVARVGGGPVTIVSFLYSDTIDRYAADPWYTQFTPGRLDGYRKADEAAGVCLHGDLEM